MPVNQPPISDDQAQASWQYELTRTINELEFRLGQAEQTILTLSDRVKALEDAE